MPAKFLVFVDVSNDDLQVMAAASDLKEVRTLLEKKMAIDVDKGFAQEVMSDFHYHNYAFMKNKMCASNDKISAFLSIMKELYLQSTAGRMTQYESFELFKELMLVHSVHRPPYSVGVFSHEDIKRTQDYVLNTFLRHYKLYEYLYVTNREVTIQVKPEKFIPILPKPVEYNEYDEVDPADFPELNQVFEQAAPYKLQIDQEPKEVEVPMEDPKIQKARTYLDKRCDELLMEFEGKIAEQDRQVASVAGQ